MAGKEFWMYLYSFDNGVHSTVKSYKSRMNPARIVEWAKGVTMFSQYMQLCFSREMSESEFTNSPLAELKER